MKIENEMKTLQHGTVLVHILGFFVIHLKIIIIRSTYNDIVCFLKLGTYEFCLYNPIEPCFLSLKKTGIISGDATTPEPLPVYFPYITVLAVADTIALLLGIHRLLILFWLIFLCEPMAMFAF